MGFKDLDEFFEDSLSLPVGGKTYTVPAPDIDTGLWVQRLVEAGKAGTTEEVDDAGELEMYQRCLGPVYDELVAAGVSWPRIKHVGMTAFLWVAGNVKAAEDYWENGQDPEYLARMQNRAARRSGSKTKTASAAARTTRKAASTNGTRKPNSRSAA